MSTITTGKKKKTHSRKHSCRGVLHQAVLWVQIMNFCGENEALFSTLLLARHPFSLSWYHPRNYQCLGGNATKICLYKRCLLEFPLKMFARFCLGKMHLFCAHSNLLSENCLCHFLLIFYFPWCLYCISYLIPSSVYLRFFCLPWSSMLNIYQYY